MLRVGEQEGVLCSGGNRRNQGRLHGGAAIGEVSRRSMRD
jgi:hypothetical protein